MTQKHPTTPDSSRQRAAGATRTAVLAALIAVAGAGLGAWMLLSNDPPEAPHPTFSSMAAVDRPLAAVPGQEERRFPEELDYKLERLDPSKDGWDTEVLSTSVNRRLGELKKLMVHPGQISVEHLAPLLGPEFECETLRPSAGRAEYESAAVSVWRSQAAAGQSPHRGAAGLASSLAGMLEPFSDGAELHGKLKLARIRPLGSELETKILVQISGPTADGLLQQNAVWRMRWAVESDGSTSLTGIALESFEEVRGPSDRETLYGDATRAVLGSDPSFGDQLLPGQTYWSGTLDAALGSQILGHAGLAIGDVNGDDLEDLYVTQGGGLPNRLFLQQPDGTAIDASVRSRIDYLDTTLSALLIDLDNDGDQDLVASPGPLVFHSNDGKGRFKVEAVVQTSIAFSLAAADYDDDGDLDLYVCRYSSPEESAPAPYHDANNGTPNLMLRNDGNWKFTDVTTDLGLDANNKRYSFAAAWADYDEDGDQDLYVANDFGRNNLYRNDGGRFTDVAGEAGVEDISAGMSATWGDYNNDGHLDLYVSNMWSSAGQRTTYQRRFKQTTDDTVRRQFQRHARGNSLFESTGDGSFRDVSVEAGVTMARWAWGSKFVDMNNDGLEDLFAVNGYVTNDDPHDL